MQNIERWTCIRKGERTIPRIDGVAAGAPEVAIVGAGVIGLAIAWHLVEAGVEGVAVVERSGVGAEASGVQPGGVRQQWATRVNCEMARESVDFYRLFRERLECSVDPRLEACGYVFLAHSTDALGRLAAGVALQNGLAIPSRLLTAEEAAGLVEGLDAASVLGAAFCAEDGYFDKPQAVVEGFAEAVRVRGVAIERGDVTALAHDGGGWRLDLGDGRRLFTEQVVVAAGYDSPAVVARLGLELPIRKEPRYLFFSDPIRQRVLEPLVVSAERRFAAKQLASGRVLASDLGARGCPEENEPSWRRHVRVCIDELTPRLQLVSFPLLVEGFYDVTPDHQAILGPVDGLPGLWLAAGFSGHGFMMAPAVGRAVAAAIVGGAHEPWLDELAPGRFAHGRLVDESQVV